MRSDTEAEGRGDGPAGQDQDDHALLAERFHLLR